MKMFVVPPSGSQSRWSASTASRRNYKHFLKKQGEKEIKELRKSLSRIPFSLSPCPHVPISPLPNFYGVVQEIFVKVNENARTLPPSAGKTSVILNVQVPFPFCPLNAASGVAGLNEPV
jgi:hypothetical protein